MLTEDTLIHENGVIDIFSKDAYQKLHARFPRSGLKLFATNDFNVNISNVTILEQLARGAYGVVYKGLMNRNTYAVKIEDIQIDVEEQVNILTELTILQSIPHSRLVKFNGAGYLTKSNSVAKVMIVLELCQNGALREVIKSDPPWHMLIQLALDIVHGLLWLHENHIVHRDIKTTNVLIDENFRAKLCDFSFCCHDTATSKHEFIYGTDEFMAPEIAMGEDFDCAADIFSFGILLCEMITNREPSDTFLKRRAKELFALNEEELRSAIPEDCPESLEALTLQCCDLDPLKRPSAEGCVDWLQSIFEDYKDRQEVESDLHDIQSDNLVVNSTNPIREGNVTYPRTLTDPSILSSSRSQGSFNKFTNGDLTCGDTGAGGEKKTQTAVESRLAFLDFQMQELMAENKRLSRDVYTLTLAAEKWKILAQRGQSNGSEREQTLDKFENTSHNALELCQRVPFRSDCGSPPAVSPAIVETNTHSTTTNNDVEKLRLVVDHLLQEVQDLNSRLNKSDVKQTVAEQSNIGNYHLSQNISKSNCLSEQEKFISLSSDLKPRSRSIKKESYQLELPDTQSAAMSFRDTSVQLDAMTPVQKITTSQESLELDTSSSGLFEATPSLSRSELSNSKVDNLALVVRSYLDVVDRCQSINNETSRNLSALDSKVATKDFLRANDKGGTKNSSDMNNEKAMPVANIRTTEKSEFHYSPHMGFLSQRTQAINASSASNSPLETQRSHEIAKATKSSIALTPDDEGYLFHFGDSSTNAGLTSNVRSNSHQHYQQQHQSRNNYRADSRRGVNNERSMSGSFVRKENGSYDVEPSENGLVSAMSNSTRGSRLNKSPRRDAIKKYVDSDALTRKSDSPQRVNRYDYNDFENPSHPKYFFQAAPTVSDKAKYHSDAMSKLNSSLSSNFVISSPTIRHGSPLRKNEHMSSESELSLRNQLAKSRSGSSSAQSLGNIIFKR